MKLLFLFLSLNLFVTSCSENKSKELKTTAFLSVTETEHFDLKNIEKKIEKALISSIIAKSSSSIDSVIKTLETPKNPLEEYWYGYALYNKAILGIVIKDSKMSKDNLNKGIELLLKSKKSSETYALLGTLQSLYVQFASNIEKGNLSKKASKNFMSSLRLEKNNLRAHLGLGRMDFYTPKEYGGGKNVENYLLKTIECQDQVVKNQVMPSWGRKEAFELLIQFYASKKEMELGKKYYKEAIKIYPNDYKLKSYANLFI
jgi:tetratricopeptide (TPR) repeat protein